MHYVCNFILKEFCNDVKCHLTLLSLSVYTKVSRWWDLPFQQLFSLCWIPHLLWCLWKWSKKFSCMNLMLAVVGRTFVKWYLLNLLSFCWPRLAKVSIAMLKLETLYFPLPWQNPAGLIVLTQPGQRKSKLESERQKEREREREEGASQAQGHDTAVLGATLAL